MTFAHLDEEIVMRRRHSETWLEEVKDKDELQEREKGPFSNKASALETK